MVRIVTLVALVVACSAGAGVRLEVVRRQPSEPISLVLTSRDPAKQDAIEMITVLRSKQRPKGSSDFVQWVLIRDPAGVPVPVPLELKYGERRDGFLMPAPALPLETGAYQVRVKSTSGSRTFSFIINPNGWIQ